MATFASCTVPGTAAGPGTSSRPELESRGHRVVAPDLPCEDVDAGVVEYAAVVCDALGGDEDAIVVGHSLGGLTIPFVPGRAHVFLCALVGGTGWSERVRPRLRRRPRP